MPEYRQVRIADVAVTDRHRTDMGDLEGLAASMAGAAGLLHPVGLQRQGLRLVFGGRRLAAGKLNGWDTIPALIFDNLDDAVVALIAERDENSCRKEMTPTELVSLGRRLEELEKPAARERQAATQAKKGQKIGGQGAGKLPAPLGAAQPKGSGKFPEASKGDTRDRIGKALGIGGKSYEKAKQVIEAAEKEPEKYGDLPATMDAKSVDLAHREMRRRRGDLPPKKEKNESPRAVQSPASPLYEANEGKPESPSDRTPPSELSSPSVSAPTGPDPTKYQTPPQVVFDWIADVQRHLTAAQSTAAKIFTSTIGGRCSYLLSTQGYHWGIDPDAAGRMSDPIYGIRMQNDVFDAPELSDLKRGFNLLRNLLQRADPNVKAPWEEDPPPEGGGDGA